MDEAVFDKIIQNLEFEVEAVHEENTVRYLGVENATPLNVKIRVRKKNETGVLHPDFISVPKFVQSNKMPNKIRLVNSDQTIVSFNLLMESDYGQNHIAPRKRKHFFGVFKSGGCMDPRNDDDDDYSYMPSSSARTPKTNSIVINTSNYKLKMKSNGKNAIVGNISNEPKKTKRQKRFFGYCKPGGCLDPPFNEDQYSYKPSYPEKTIFPVKKKSSLVRESEKNKNLDLVDENEIVKLKNGSKGSSWKESESEEKLNSKTIISIFHTDSMKISLDTAYSNSIITYPPTLSSSELYLSEKRTGNNAKNANISVKKVSKPSNEYNDTFFVPPKNNSLGKKTKEIVEALRDPTELETILSQVSKEKEGNANNDTVINKEERNKKQNQHLSLLRSGTIQSDFDNLDLLTRAASCSTRRDNENSENDSIELKNNSYELKKIATKIPPKPSLTHKITSRSDQDIAIADFGIISDTKFFNSSNEIKCSQLDKNHGSALQIEKQSKNSARNFDEIDKGFTDSFTKINNIQKKDSIEIIDAIDPPTGIKNKEIRELNHGSCFDSISFKNEQGQDIISTNSTKRYLLVSNSDMKKDLKNQDNINLSSNDITLNEKQSYSDENPMVNSDSINSQINHFNKVIANESKIMTDLPGDFMLSVSKNKSDHSNIKGIISNSFKANPTSRDGSEKSKESKSNACIKKESIIKERTFDNSTESHNYLTKGGADSPKLLDSVTINGDSSMKPLFTPIIHRSENTIDDDDCIEKESNCKERMSHTSASSNNYLSNSQSTNSIREDSPNLLDSVTLHDNPSMKTVSTTLTHNITTENTNAYVEEPKIKEKMFQNSTNSHNDLTKSDRHFTKSSLTDSTNLLDSVTINDIPSIEPLSISSTHNISTENINTYVEKESKTKEEMSHNSNDSHNYLNKSDRRLTISSLTDSTNLLDSVTLNDIPSMQPLSIPVSHNISIENTNVYVEKEPKIKEKMSQNSNYSQNYLNKRDRQLTSSSCSNSLNLLDSIILNEHPLTEFSSIPLPHSNILTENTSNNLFEKSQHLTNTKNDELSKQSKINIIKHQNLTIFNSSSNLNYHDVDADSTEKKENLELEPKNYGKTNNLDKLSNDDCLENKKINNVSPKNESKVSKLSSSFKAHENDFEKPSKNSLTIKDLKKLDSHENFHTSMKLLELNEKNLIFNSSHQYNIDHLHPEKTIQDSRYSTDSSMRKFIIESPNLKPNNKNSHSKLLLYINEKSEQNENKTVQAMDANSIESLSKSINSNSQSSEKLLSPTSLSNIFNVEQVKNKSEKLWGKLLDNDSKGDNTQIENSITKSDNTKYHTNQDRAFVTILPEGDKFNNFSKTKINLISESLHDSFNSSDKSISSYIKIKTDMEKNELLANSHIKTTPKYDLAGIDSTTKEDTQFSHSSQTEKSENAVFYDDASSRLKETDILNKDGINVNNTLMRDTASIKHAVIKHSEILSEKGLTDVTQCLMDSEPLLPYKNNTHQGSLREIYEQNVISHHNLLNLISEKSTKNSIPDLKFASKSTIKSEIILDLGFQSYYNYVNNQKVLKSLDTSIVNVRYPYDAVTVIKSANLHDNEIKVSIDSETDMCIQILQKNKIKLDKNQKANHNIEDIQSIIKKPIKEDKNNTRDNCLVIEDVAQSYEIALENTLKSVYEQQLIPLQDMIRSLKSEIDNLADQQSNVRGTVFKSDLNPTNRIRSVRLIRTNKRCRCLKK